MLYSLVVRQPSPSRRHTGPIKEPVENEELQLIKVAAAPAVYSETTTAITIMAIELQLLLGGGGAIG